MEEEREAVEPRGEVGLSLLLPPRPDPGRAVAGGGERRWGPGRGSGLRRVGGGAGAAWRGAVRT